MGSYYAKQPNGLYLRFSSIVDCPTMINMSLDEIEEQLIEEAQERIKYDLISIQKHPHSIEEVKNDYSDYNGNMSREDFEILLRKIEMPIDKCPKMEYT